MVNLNLYKLRAFLKSKFVSKLKQQSQDRVVKKHVATEQELLELVEYFSEDQALLKTIMFSHY